MTHIGERLRSRKCKTKNKNFNYCTGYYKKEELNKQMVDPTTIIEADSIIRKKDGHFALVTQYLQPQLLEIDKLDTCYLWYSVDLDQHALMNENSKQ